MQSGGVLEFVEENMIVSFAHTFIDKGRGIVVDNFRYDFLKILYQYEVLFLFQFARYEGKLGEHAHAINHIHGLFGNLVVFKFWAVNDGQHFRGTII